MGVMIPFSLGRVFAYTMIALIASGSSVLVRNIINDNLLFNTLLGSATVLMGSYMLYGSLKHRKSCGIHHPETSNTTPSKLGFFAIGAGISVNLCPPVLTLITLSSNTTDLYSAMGLGLSFGLGAVLFTLFFYGFFLSHLIRGILEQFASYKKAVEVTASIFLILVGVLIINGKMTL